MVKKVFCLFLIAIIVFSLSSCGSNASDYAKEHGQIAVEIAEDYLAGKISADSASSKLEYQESLIRKKIETIENETNKYPYADSLIAACVYACSVSIWCNSVGSQSKQSVEEDIKDLKKALK